MIDLSKRTGFDALAGDFEVITKRIMDNQQLCKLLAYNTGDALKRDDLTTEDKAKLFEDGVIRLIPDLYVGEEVGSFIVITYDNFYAGENPKFIPCVMTIDILCHTDLWMIDERGKRSIRPYKIADLIMREIHDKKFAGIGTAQFISGNSLMLVSDADYAGLSLKFEMMNHV